jgi:hypothetical protein
MNLDLSYTWEKKGGMSGLQFSCSLFKKRTIFQPSPNKIPWTVANQHMSFYIYAFQTFHLASAFVFVAFVYIN